MEGTILMDLINNGGALKVLEIERIEVPMSLPEKAGSILAALYVHHQKTGERSLFLESSRSMEHLINILRMLEEGRNLSSLIQEEMIIMYEKLPIHTSPHKSIVQEESRFFEILENIESKIVYRMQEFLSKKMEDLENIVQDKIVDILSQFIEILREILRESEKGLLKLIGQDILKFEEIVKTAIIRFGEKIIPLLLSLENKIGKKGVAELTSSFRRETSSELVSKNSKTAEDTCNQM
jgi:hypothetical protein